MLILASHKNVNKALSDTTQRKWISDVYKALSLKFSKVTHANQGSSSRIAKTLNIEEEQIQYAGCWNTNPMHRGYLTTLPQKICVAWLDLIQIFPARIISLVQQLNLLQSFCLLFGALWINGLIFHLLILVLCSLLNCSCTFVLFFFKIMPISNANFLAILCFLILCFWCRCMEPLLQVFWPIKTRKRQIRIFSFGRQCLI